MSINKFHRYILTEMNWNKNKSRINLLIDGIMFVLLALIAGLGFLIEYVLVPGFKRNVLYGRDVDIYFLGLDRHQWGSIHLYLGLIFLGLMLVHIVLHWKMITCIFRQMITGKASRNVVAVCTGIVALFFVLAPFFIKPEVSPLERKYTYLQNIGQLMEESQNVGRNRLSVSKSKEVPAITIQSTTENLNTRQSVKVGENDFSEIEINGSMTLKEVSQKYSIPVNELTKAMNIPAKQANERIGRLKRRYGFEMTELKNKVAQLKKNNE